MFKKILVPLDGSRFGSGALKYAGEMAKLCGAEVLLLQAVIPAAPIPSPSSMLPGVIGPETTGLSVEIAQSEDKRNMAKAKRYLAGKARNLKARGIPTSYKAVLGDPADVILKQARGKKTDVVIMTSHGKSGLKRALLGSVTDEVVRKSRKPVMVIRPKSREA
jgi:nucleotide-binding universal stress UspA family protein